MLSGNIWPRLLIVTEEPMRANSSGFGRTMVNIFQNYPIANLLFYVPNGKYNHPDYQLYNSSFITYGNNKLHYKKPKFYANTINALLNIVNTNWQTIRPLKKQLQQIQDFNPDYILVVPMGKETLLEGYRITNCIKKPFYIYLMDDWMQSNFYYLGGSFQLTVKKILQNASGWLMISKYLQQELESRYNIIYKPTLVLHNPVDTDNLHDYESLETDEFIIGYAGSIWQFHFDGLENVAKAIYQLRNKGIRIKLMLYTQLFFWQKDEATYLKYEVEYGGLIKYDELFDTLNKCHLLLCTTSFKPENKHIVGTSVFTKITDYMASCRPVWCYGPEYAANNRFLLENNFNYANSFLDSNDLQDFILEAKQNDKENKDIVTRQNILLQKEFNSKIVINKLTQFIKHVQ